MFFLPAYPFWSLIIIAADIGALYGLCAYGSRANLQPPKPEGRMAMRNIRASAKMAALTGVGELCEVHGKASAQYECPP